jgi:predicted transcriptional regulator
MLARDIMTQDVISLSPGMSVADAADALLHYRIHGAPVVDGADQLVGMVSFTDLSGRAGGTISDVMTADAVFVLEDTPVEEIAALMLDQMVRRVPVVSGGRVTGIVSASDIIQVFLNLHEAGPRQAEAPAPAPLSKRAPLRRPMHSPKRALAAARVGRSPHAARARAGRRTNIAPRGKQRRDMR